MADLEQWALAVYILGPNLFVVEGNREVVSFYRDLG